MRRKCKDVDYRPRNGHEDKSAAEHAVLEYVCPAAGNLYQRQRYFGFTGAAVPTSVQALVRSVRQT